MKKLISRTRGKSLVLGCGICFGFIFPLIHSNIQPTRAAGAGAEDGASTYSANCAGCHGTDGKAKTAKGKRTGATDLTSNWNADEARATRIITNGRGEMPSFKSKLSKEEIAGVLGYIKGFRQ